MRIHRPACKNRMTPIDGTDGILSSRLPFSAAREKPCGFLPASSLDLIAICTTFLHSSYTAKKTGIIFNKDRVIRNPYHLLRMTA